MASRIGSHFHSVSGDYTVGLWNQWWVARSLEQGQNPFHTDFLNYPDGVSLLWRDLPLLGNVVGAPLTWAFGPTAAYNLIHLGTFVVAALGAYLLGRYFTGSSLAALGCGVAYAYTPAHFLALGQQSTAHIEWLPFLALSLMKLRDRGWLRDGVVAGIWLACTLHCNIYYGIYCGLAAAILWSWYMFFPSNAPAGRVRWTRGLLICFAVAFALFSFRGIPMILESAELELEAAGSGTRADLIGVSLDPRSAPASRLVSWPSVLGYWITFGAGCAAFRLGRKRAALGCLLVLFFFYLAQGQTLRIAGSEISSVPMLVDAFKRLPLLESLRAHHRAMIVPVLVLSVGFAFFLSMVEGGLDSKTTGRRLAVVTILLLAILELWPPSPHEYSPAMTQSIEERMEGTDSRALLPIPFDILPRPMKESAWLQTMHGRPLVGCCMCSRPNPRHRQRMQESKFLASLMLLDPERPTRKYEEPTAETVATLRGELERWQIGFVLLDTRYVLPLEEAASSDETRLLSPRRSQLELRLDSFFAPLWWGPLGVELIQQDNTSSQSDKFPQAYIHPSVLPYLRAVLGGPGESLPSGLLMWRI